MRWRHRSSQPSVTPAAAQPGHPRGARKAERRRDDGCMAGTGLARFIALGASVLISLGLASARPIDASHEPRSGRSKIELRVSLGGSLEGGLFTQFGTPYCVTEVRPPAATIGRAFGEVVLVTTADIETCAFHEAVAQWVFTDLGPAGISTARVSLHRRSSGPTTLRCSDVHAGLRCEVTRESDTRFRLVIVDATAPS